MGDSNRNESEGGDHIAEFRRKKGKKPKAKPLKWRSTNSDMDDRCVDEAEGSDDVVLSSLTSAGSSFSSLISRQGVRTLGKVAEGCDSVDPPVPRKLRSAINNRAGRTLPSSPRHAKKRRHLSAISAQIFLMDHETRFNETTTSNSFTKEEEVLADTLLALSQKPSVCESAAEMGTGEDISSINVASTSCSEGAMKVDCNIIILSIDDNEARPATVDQEVERTGSVPQVDPDLNAPHNSINLHIPKDGQIQDLSLGLVVTSSNASKDSSNNSTQNQPKLQFDASRLANPTKSEAPQWLVSCNKPRSVVSDGTRNENNSVQEVTFPVRTPLPCMSTGHSTKPSSSTSWALAKPATETAKASTTENKDKLSLSKNDEPTKTWKKSMTHVYVSHLIQTHLDKEKASQNLVKPVEISHSRISTPPSGFTLNKNKAHIDASLPVQQTLGFRDTAASRQKMVSSNNLNLPTSVAFSGVQYVQYLHPQMMAHRGPTPYPYPHHLPCSRGNLAPTMTVQQQMQQYMCNPGYAPHPGPASMKLQQFAPTPQQQQQMWQYHFSQYHQPRPAEGGTPVVSWQNNRLQDMSSSSTRPMLAPRPPPMMMPPPPQMEILCAPYQGSGGGRRPPQLRLI